MRASSLFSPYRKLSRPIWVLFFVQVINRLGDFVAPFMALFLTLKLGLSAADAGFWVTFTIFAGLAGIMVSGKISDCRGRKPVLIASLAFSAATIGVAGFFAGRAWIVWILVIMSFFQGMMRPAIAALIADLTPADQRKDAFALNYLGINIGVAVGPMIAAFLFERSIEWLFWADALSTCAAITLAALFIPHRDPREIHAAQAENHEEKTEEGSSLAAFLARPLLVCFCLLLLTDNFIYTQTHFALPLSTVAKTYGWLMSFNAIVVVSVTPVMNLLTRRQNPITSMILGSLFYAIGFGMLAFPFSTPLLLVSTLVWTLGEILFSINTGVYLAAKTPQNLRGQFQAYREFITSIGRMAGPAVGGLLAANLGIHGLWFIVGIIGLVSAAGFLWLRKAEAKVA
jgi:MFS family permease